MENHTKFILLLTITFLAAAFSIFTCDDSYGASTIYVNDATGDDTNNGETPTTAKKTIKNATGTVDPNGNVLVANGTYTGIGNINITLDRNLNINGDSNTGTIVDAQNSGWIFYIPAGFTVTISNISLINGNAIGNYGAAVRNEGTVTLNNCIFTGNIASFSGAVGNIGTCVINECSFTGNSALINGGAIANDGSLTINKSTFNGNSAGNNGGAIASDGTLIMTESTLIGNSAVNGGAIANLVIGPNIGYAQINFCRIVGNTAINGNAISNDIGGIVNAENNWWGTNIGPAGQNFGVMDDDPWITLRLTANPTTIYNGGTSNILADFTWNSDNIQPIGGFIPAVPTTLTTTWGTLSGQTAMSNGLIQALFTANGGPAPLIPVQITANADGYITNATESAYITILKAADLYIVISSSNNNPKVGQIFTVTYKLGNKGPDAAQNVNITINLPPGFYLTNISGDGSWSQPNSQTIIWTLSNVPVGDPYLYISGRVLRPGTFIFGSSISSETYNINSQGVTPLRIVINPVNAKTIDMQNTGTPLSYLLLGLVMIMGGFLYRRK